MKYYNKQWYDLMQKIDYTVGMEIIPDKDYTNEEIEQLYNKKMNEYVEFERLNYDEQPDFSHFKQELEAEEFNNEHWIFVDEKTNTVITPSSKEEVISHLEQEEKQALEEFGNRKPFNEKRYRKDFKKMYKNMLKCKELVPQWVYEKVDERLIALNLLPQNIFNKLKSEEDKNKKKFQSIENKAMKELNKQNIKPEIENNFCFYDGVLKSIKEKDDNLVMVIDCQDSFESRIKTVVFKNAEIIEMEKIKNKKSTYLYEEIYSKKYGYEVHMMFECNGLKYITLKCKDIKIKDNSMI